MRIIYSYFYKTSIVKIILIGIFLPLIFNILAHVVFALLSNGAEVSHMPGRIEKYTTFSFILTVTIIAPLIETLLIQYLPVKICQAIFRKYKYSSCITVFLSSLLFASLHMIDVLYFSVVLFSGFIWAFSCLIFMRKKRHPFVFTAITHACYNGILVFCGVIIQVLGIYSPQW